MVDTGETSLTRVHARTPYNAAERRFSCIVQERLHELLEGKRNELPLLRRYPNRPERLGVMVTPPEVARATLRPSVVEALTWNAVAFICPTADGGPIAQEVDANGSIIETQIFATRFPHIIMQRVDRYEDEEADPVDITWCLQRVQNQRQQTQLNRLLDAANLGLDLVKLIRP